MIAIIPARGGSKGLPKKNMKIFNGRPLIQTTIDAAKESKLVDFVYVSTDDREISDFSKSCGAESPFLRPKELSEDKSLINDTLKYMIKKLENEHGVIPGKQIPEIPPEQANITDVSDPEEDKDKLN